MEDRRLSPLTRTILTVFGLGHVRAGASAASLLAVGVWYGLSFLEASFAVHAVLVAAVFVCATAAVAASEVEQDPREVVVDEFLGMYAALLFVPAGDHRGALVLLVAFRVLDIFKVPPFSWIERWRGPLAILLDDVAIGVTLGLAYTGMARALRP